MASEGALKAAREINSKQSYHMGGPLSVAYVAEIIDRCMAPAPPGFTSEQVKCPTCDGDRVVMSTHAGAGHSDDLAEYIPCPDCSLPARDYDFHGNPPNAPARPELDKDEGGGAQC